MYHRHTSTCFCMLRLASAIIIWRIIKETSQEKKLQKLADLVVHVQNILRLYTYLGRELAPENRIIYIHGLWHNKCQLENCDMSDAMAEVDLAGLLRAFREISEGTWPVYVPPTNQKGKKGVKKEEAQQEEEFVFAEDREEPGANEKKEKPVALPFDVKGDPSFQIALMIDATVQVLIAQYCHHELVPIAVFKS